MREARKQIAALTRSLAQVEADRSLVEDELANTTGTRWWQARAVVRWAKRRPWRWAMVPAKLRRLPQGHPCTEVGVSGTLAGCAAVLLSTPVCPPYQFPLDISKGGFIS